MSDMHTWAARNQVLFREINERIREIGDIQRVRADEPLGFLCECADEACTETVPLTVAEYEEIRTSPTWFPIKPGHELPEVEAVVDRRERYIVVQKEAEAADLARANDPRAGDASPVT